MFRSESRDNVLILRITQKILHDEHYIAQLATKLDYEIQNKEPTLVVLNATEAVQWSSDAIRSVVNRLIKLSQNYKFSISICCATTVFWQIIDDARLSQLFVEEKNFPTEEEAIPVFTTKLQKKILIVRFIQQKLIDIPGDLPGSQHLSEVITSTKSTSIVLNFSAVEFICGTDVGAFVIKPYKMLNTSNCMSVCNVRTSIWEQFERMKLLQLFARQTNFPTEDAAIAALQ